MKKASKLIRILPYIYANNQMLNYNKYEREFIKQYPVAYNLFLKFESKELNYTAKYNAFFLSFGITFYPTLTSAIKENYKGTYNVKIQIKKEVAISLGREKKFFHYSGYSSNENAMIKGLSKCFEIIECVQTGQYLPEKKRITR